VGTAIGGDVATPPLWRSVHQAEPEE